MKRIILFYCMALFLLSCITLLFWYRDLPCPKVHITGEYYPVVFEDSTLSKASRQRIVSDLKILAALVSSFEELQASIRRLTKRNATISIAHCEEGNHLQIDKTLSDTYQQAFARMDAHPDAVKKAHKLLAYLNRTDLTSLPGPELRKKLFHVEVENIRRYTIPDAEFESHAAWMQEYEFQKFSALHFSLKWVPPFGGKDIPVIDCPVAHKLDPSKKGSMPIDFYNGRWGFGRHPGPDPETLLEPPPSQP